MNTVTEARVDLAEALDGVQSISKVYDHLPSKMTLPAAVVVPAAPYVQSGPGLGKYTIRLTVLLITKAAASNKVVTESLDSLIVNTLDALNPDYLIPEIDEPSLFTLDGNEYLGTSFTIETIYTKESND